MNHQRTLEQLWQDYLFLTNEMLKFLDKQDFDLFIELMSQRGNIQHQIEESACQKFKFSLDGQKLLRDIQQIEQTIKLRLEYFRNNSKRHIQVSNAYEGYSSSIVGYRMDRQS